MLSLRFCAHRHVYVNFRPEVGLRGGDCAEDCTFARHFEAIDGVTVVENDAPRLERQCHARAKPCGDVHADERERWAFSDWALADVDGTSPPPCVATDNRHPLSFVNRNERFLGHRLPLYIGDVVFAYQALRPRAHIAKPVAEMSRRWRLREFGVGVHVRRTDQAVNEASGDDERQLREMAAALEREPRTVFYLAADNAASQRQFEEAFPGRVRYYAQLEERPHVRRQTNASVALMDLFTLAECRTLVLSSSSSFGRMAEGLQCARSNGRVGRWCSEYVLGERLRPEWTLVYEGYEKALSLKRAF